MKNYKLLLIYCLMALTACTNSNVETERPRHPLDLPADSTVSDKELHNNEEPLELAPETYRSTNLDSLGIELMSLSTIGGIKIGMNTDDVTAILGNPEIKSEPEEWPVDGGIHEFWYYSDSSLVLEFVNYSSHEDNALEIIDLRDSCEFKTDRGITIGSNIESVKSNYAKAIELSDWTETENQILLGDPGNGGLFFTIRENLICHIRIGPMIRC